MQEDEPGTHNSIRQIAPRISISKSSVHRLVKKKNLRCFKRLKTPQMNSACRKRRTERAEKLLQRFSIHSFPQLVFQDEKGFSLQVPTNCQNNRWSQERRTTGTLVQKRKQVFEKGYVYAVITWKGLSQPFFIGGNGIKVNGASYMKHLVMT